MLASTGNKRSLSLWERIKYTFRPKLKRRARKKEDEKSRAILIQIVLLVCLTLVVTPTLFERPYKFMKSIKFFSEPVPNNPFTAKKPSSTAHYVCKRGEDVSEFLDTINFYSSATTADNFMQCHKENCDKISVKAAKCANVKNNVEKDDTPTWNCDFEFDQNGLTTSYSKFEPYLCDSRVTCSNADGLQENDQSPRARAGWKEVCTPCWLTYCVEEVSCKSSDFVWPLNIIMKLNSGLMGYVFGLGSGFFYTVFMVLVGALVVALLNAFYQILAWCFGWRRESDKWRGRNSRSYTNFFLNTDSNSKRHRSRLKNNVDFLASSGDESSSSDSSDDEFSTRSKGTGSISNRIYGFLQDYVLPFTVSDGSSRSRRRVTQRRKYKKVEMQSDSDSSSSDSDSSTSSSDSDFLSR